MSFHFKFKKNMKRGFTLTELMVSISIAIAILTIVVFNQATYIDAASLKNSVEDLSLSLSEAQVFGTSVRQVTPGSNEFQAAYGVSVNTTSSGSNNAYIFFADTGSISSDKYYDGEWECSGGTDQCLRKQNISNRNIITDICAISTANVENCDVGRVDISFLRPDVNARFVYFRNTGVIWSLAGQKGVRIEMQSPAGKRRSVVVYDTGQISVQ